MAEWEKKLRLACEMWAAKVEALKQKAEERGRLRRKGRRRNSSIC